MDSTAAQSLLLSRSLAAQGAAPKLKLTKNDIRCLSSSSPRSSPLKSFANLKLKRIRCRLPPLRCSAYVSGESKAAKELGLLLEVEGVLADAHRHGNRQAFNVAFQKLGLDCANWTEPIYADLIRKAGDNEERMLILFFNKIGWPTSLPTNEKETFMRSIWREKKALEEFANSSNLPLRPGVESFIDDALNEGIPVVMLTAYSKNGDKMSRSIIEKLGLDRITKIKIVGKEEVEGSFYGQLVLGKGVSSSLDNQLAKEAQKAVTMEKQRIAEEVASALKVSIDIGTSPSESSEKIVAALHAGAEYAGLPVPNCVLIAGSQPAVLVAEQIGMPSVVIRSSLTARAEFHAAKAILDGFGGADLTISKLRNNKW